MQTITGHRRILLAVTALALLAAAGCARTRQPAPGPTPGTASQATTASTEASAPSPSDATPAPSPESPLITLSKPKPPALGTTRPTDAEVAAVAVKLGKAAGEFDTATSTKVIGVTQDSKSHWWAFVDIKYTGPSGDGDQQFIIENNGHSWDIITNGTGLTYDDLPSDVRF